MVSSEAASLDCGIPARFGVLALFRETRLIVHRPVAYLPQADQLPFEDYFLIDGDTTGIESKLLPRGRMRHIGNLAAPLSLWLVLATPNSFSQTDRQHKLIRTLAEQGFSGSLAGKISLSELGHLNCGVNAYRVVFYEWEETNPPGKAIHSAQRLIFLAGTRYVGSYVIEDRPVQMTSASILFRYTENLGHAIVCDEIGPGKRVLLNGEPQVFSK